MWDKILKIINFTIIKIIYSNFIKNEKINIKKVIKKKIKKGILFLTCEQKLIEILGKKKKKISIIPTSRLQILSIGTCLIPFVEHNDANRAVMGSNMQRQAVPIIKKQKPIVCTGIENIISHNNEHNSCIINNGIVKFSGLKKIITHENITSTYRTDDLIKINTFTNSFIKKRNKQTNKQIYKKYIVRKYIFKKVRSSNQNIYLCEKSIVNKNELIKKNQIITDGPSTLQGKLSLGRNILIAYMPWKGYNFEDAIIISERIKMHDLFTSLHIKKYKTYVTKNDTGEVRVKNLERKKLKLLKVKSKFWKLNIKN